jgi:aminoglycoside phosphotransferase (APT) family kinase protein
MASPPATPPASDDLAAALGARQIEDLHRLTGGASRETWAFRADGTELVLRRDPPGRPSAEGAMQREADALRACHRSGLRVPEVVAAGEGWLVMRRVPGETIPRRILRDDAFAAARPRLVSDLGRFLGGLHAIELTAIPGLGPRNPLTHFRAMYERMPDRSAVIEKAFAWLEANAPTLGPEVVVHGDLRLGNVIVDERGLAAVLDWELVHVGDALEDLSWLCLKAWRFGGAGEVAGVGSLDELLAAYGRPVDRTALHWWLVMQTTAWGVGCMAQADHHLSGRVRSVDLAAVGRRVAEQEWDVLELVAPEACALARAAAPPAMAEVTAPYGRPTAAELVEAVRELLEEQLDAEDDPRFAYQARVGANLLRIVERELVSAPPARGGADWPSLAMATRDRLLVANPKHLG